MIQRYALTFLVAAAFSLLFYVGMEWAQKADTKYKYKIRTENQVFRTNSFTKSTEGCIQFLDRGELPTTACGNYTIEQTRN